MLGAGALAGLSPRPAEAVVKLDVTQGNVQPIPIAIPDFVGVATQDPVRSWIGLLARRQPSMPVDCGGWIESGRDFFPVLVMLRFERANGRPP
jgi:hypothetical protein